MDSDSRAQTRTIRDPPHKVLNFCGVRGKSLRDFAVGYLRTVSGALWYLPEMPSFVGSQGVREIATVRRSGASCKKWGGPGDYD